jgi:hypothetical protein
MARTKYKGKIASGRAAHFTYWDYKALRVFRLPVGSLNGVLEQHRKSALFSLRHGFSGVSGSDALHMIPHDVYAKCKWRPQPTHQSIENSISLLEAHFCL